MTPATLHALYCRESGLKVDLKRGLCDTELECAWLTWIKAGFVEDDLIAVIRYVKRNQRPKGVYPKETLNPASMLYVGRFKVLLGFAQDDERNRKRPMTDREAVMKATGRNGETEPKPKTPAIVLGATEAEWIKRMREAAK